MRLYARKHEFVQVGVVTYGHGINPRAWIEEARKRGLYVLLCEGYAEFYRRRAE